jgi:hypothetical protein
LRSISPNGDRFCIGLGDSKSLGRHNSRGEKQRILQKTAVCFRKFLISKALTILRRI